MKDITYCTNKDCKAGCKRKDRAETGHSSFSHFKFAVFKGIHTCDHIIPKFEPQKEKQWECSKSI